MIRNYNREETYLKPGCPVTQLDDERISIKNVSQGLGYCSAKEQYWIREELSRSLTDIIIISNIEIQILFLITYNLHVVQGL